MSNLLKRTLSGILFIVVFIGCILWGEISFCILFTIVTALAIMEFNTLLESHQLAQPSKNLSTFSGVYLFLASFLFFLRGFSAIVFLPYFFLVLLIIISENYLKKQTPLANWAYAIASQVYIAFPFALLNALANFIGYGYSALLPLCVFIFIWINDTGAYVCGSLLHKYIPYHLSPRISPNKTWVGSIGGAVIVTLAGLLIHIITKQFTPLMWIGLGLTIVVFGTLGDLVESLFKRQLEIKDSGNFLPGHGGVLDRFDSALIAIPAATIYLYSFFS